MKTLLTGLLIISASILGLGCQTVTPEDFPPFYEVKFEKTEPVKIDTTKLDDNLKTSLENIMNNKIYVKLDTDGKFIQTDENSATFVLFSSTNFSEVGNLATIADAYRDTCNKQTDLCNTEIEQINALKALLEMENMKSRTYYNIWKSSDYLYRQEVKIHHRDNILSEIRFFFMGGVCIAALAL